MNSHTFSKFWQWVSTLVGIQSRSIGSEEEILPLPPPEINPFYSDIESSKPLVLPESQPLSLPIPQQEQKLKLDNSKKVQNPKRTIRNFIDTVIKILPETKKTILYCVKYILFSGGIIMLTALISNVIHLLNTNVGLVVFILGMTLTLLITKFIPGTKKILFYSIKKLLLVSGILFFTGIVVTIITMVDAWVNFWFFIFGMTLILFIINIISHSNKMKQIIAGCLLGITLFLSQRMIVVGWNSAPDFIHWWYASLGALLCFIVLMFIGTFIWFIKFRNRNP
jgi:hypothetical protein